MTGEEEWFKFWFDSPYYDLLYSNRDSSEASQFINRLLNYLQPLPNARILDLACGTGRHAVYLATKGYEVTGIDLSHRSIQEAIKMERPGLEFYEHDIRNYFRINYYNYIFNFFTSFGYFDTEQENLKVLRSVNMELLAGGTVVIDFMNSVKVRRSLVANSIKEVGGITFNIHKWADAKYIYKEMTFEDKGKPYHYTEKVQAITLDDFKRYFEKTGLKLRTIFGSYDLADFDENTSDRLILIADK